MALCGGFDLVAASASSAGVTTCRQRLWGVKTPWNRVRLIRGFGTKAGDEVQWFQDDTKNQVFLTEDVHAIEEQRMKMYVQIQRAANALNQSHGPALSRVSGESRLMDQVRFAETHSVQTLAHKNAWIT